MAAHPAPAIAQVLALQQSAGNHAVAQALSRQVLAREVAYPPAHPKDDKAHWGEWGKGIDPAQLGAHIADDLLGDPKYNEAVMEILGRSWIVGMIDSVQVIRQKKKLPELLKFAHGRVKAVAMFVENPVGFDFESVGLSAEEKAHMLAKQPGERSMADELSERRMTLAMEQFSADRMAVTSAVQEAKDEAERQEKLKAVREFDSKRLPPLVALAKERKPEDRWKHPDPKVVDSVLAALQLQAVSEATSSLNEDSGDVRTRVRTDHPANDPWCGYFAAEKYGKVGFHSAFMKQSFDSTFKARAFFKYKPEWLEGGEYPNWVKADDGGWKTIPAYHNDRKSERHWYETEDIMKGGKLDIRPGDIVTISVAINDNVEKPEGDHVTMVLSYNPTTRMLFTIAGNDGGYVVRQPGEAAVDADAAAAEKRKAAEAESGQSLKKGPGANVAVGSQDLANQPTPGAPKTKVLKTHVAGIGRPSLVDFEEHEYAWKDPGAKK